MKYILTLLVFGFFLHSYGQNEKFQRESFHDADGGVLPYRILYPDHYAESEQDFPLLLFLHGAGERGSDNEKQLMHGGSLFTDPENQQNYPMVVVFPQCPEDGYWADVKVTKDCDDCPRNFEHFFSQTPNPNMKLVIELLDHLLREEKIDPARVILGGLSMGGMGTFELLVRRPHTFVRAFPICGGGIPQLTPMYSPETELWIFHGDSDVVVPVSKSQEMFEAMPGNVRYYEYAGVNHNSWDNAFAEPSLMEWIYSGKR